MSGDPLVEFGDRIEVGRKAIEAVLLEWRDRRISLLGCGNGLVVREANGEPSSIIRLSVGDALVVAMRAMYPELVPPPSSLSRRENRTV